MSNITNPYIQYMYAYPHKKSYRELNNIKIEDYLHFLENNSNHIYIHLPFCESRCGFCNLFTIIGKDQTYIDKYLDTVELQLAEYSKYKKIQNATFSSLVLGGGTPLYLSCQQLERLFNLVENYLPINLQETYIAIETSPNQSEMDKLMLIKGKGVDRISIGVQSFIDSELKALKRYHSTDQAHEALKRIKSVDFPELNIDLIYGIPGQTIESLIYSINVALSYSPEEIFAYPLYLREGTGMYRSANGYIDQRMQMYTILRDLLITKGYTQTSMRRFTLLGSEQNSDCGFDNTLSLGCGGRSYLGNLHFCEPFAVKQSECRGIVDQYMKQTDFSMATHGCILNSEEEKRRYLIKHLFYYKGISKSDYLTYFGSEVTTDFPVLAQLTDQKWISDTGQRLALTTEGLAYSDYIGPKFISENVLFKMNNFSI